MIFGFISASDDEKTDPHPQVFLGANSDEKCVPETVFRKCNRGKSNRIF